MAYSPTAGMKEEAQRGLDWRSEFGRGGTAVGIARARDITNGKDLPLDTVKRMFSFFSRHEVDKQAEGFSPGEDGFPSNGRIAWALWGGDAGFSWSRRIVESEKDKRAEKRPYPNEHAARLRDPAQYDEFRRETDAGGAGVDFIYGIKEGESEIQAIRFDAQRFTADEAQDWLEEHDFEPIEFEEATMEREIDKRHIMGVMETEDAFVISYSKHSEDYEEEEMEEPQPEMEMEEMSREVPLGQTVYRTGELRMMQEDRRMMMSVSSTTPVEREFGYEILDHSTSSVDMDFLGSGRAPLLMDHDPRQQIGVIERAWMDKEKLRAQVRFSKSERAEEIYQDIQDGIRGNVSIGYQVMGMSKMDEMREGKPVYRVNKFKPLEVSMVSIPADPAVGVGRSMPVASGDTTKTVTQETTMAEEIKITHEPDVQARQKEIESIVSWGKRHNQAELANEALLKGWTGEQFREQLLERLESKPMQTVTPDVSAKEKQAYSLVKAIRAAKLNDWSQAGLELEMSREIAKRSHRDPKGFFVPDFGWSTRTVSTASGATFGAGSNIVPEDYRGDRFIDALISTSILGTVGATVLNGLQGNVAIPKMATSTSAGWIAEGGSVGNNEPDFGQVTMTPKLLANKVNITRELMIQSDPSVEQLIRNNMVRIFAAAIDNAALKGGTSNAPTGVLATSGIGDVSSGGTSGNAALTYGNVVDIWSEVAADNALVGSLSWVTHPRVVGKLMQTVVASSTDSRMIMMGPDELLGYRVVQTTQTPGSGNGSSTPYSLLFGNFSDLLIGFWSALDVLVDPYGSAGTASTNIYFYQDVDVAVGHPESFAAAQDVTV